MSYNVIQKALSANNVLSQKRGYNLPTAPDCKSCGHPHKQHFVMEMVKGGKRISRCAGGGKIGCACRIYKQY